MLGLFRLAAELLELGEHRIDVELVGLLDLRGRRFRLFLRHGGNGSRQERRALFLDWNGLFLGRFLHFEVEINCEASPSVTGSSGVNWRSSNACGRGSLQ